MAKPEFSVLQQIKNGRRTYGITPRIPGGFIRPDKLALMAEVAEKYQGTIKITSGQRIAILGLKEEDVAKAWEDLDMEPAVRSPYSIKNVEMCPAGFCKRAKYNTLPLAMKLEKRYYGAPAPNRTKIGVAGCLNACASVNAKDIGVLAVPEGHHKIVAGGSAGFHPRLPDTIAEGLSEDEAYIMVEAVYEYYCETADMGDKLGPFIDKIGLDNFKDGVHALYKIKLEESLSEYETTESSESATE